MKTLAYIAAVVLSVQLGCKDDPVTPDKPRNRSPFIFSLTVFPEVVRPSDSLVVVCNAMDPDADTLVYDWYSLSGSIVRIKGTCLGCPDLYNTYENSRIFYAPDSQYVSAPQDTFRVQCAARDRKGGQVVGTVSFIVTRDP